MLGLWLFYFGLPEYRAKPTHPSQKWKPVFLGQRPHGRWALPRTLLTNSTATRPKSDLAWTGLRDAAEAFFKSAINLSLSEKKEFTTLTLIPLRDRLRFCNQIVVSGCDEPDRLAKQILDIVENAKLPLSQRLLARLQLADTYILERKYKSARKVFIELWDLAKKADDDLLLELNLSEPELLTIGSFKPIGIKGKGPYKPVTYRLKISESGRVYGVARISEQTIPSNWSRYAMQALRRGSVFRPALKNGIPVKSELIHHQEFFPEN